MPDLLGEDDKPPPPPDGPGLFGDALFGGAASPVSAARPQAGPEAIAYRVLAGPWAANAASLGGRPTNDPCVDPLRLLPSGPDRVGRAPVRRRPPGGNIGPGGFGRKGKEGRGRAIG